MYSTTTSISAMSTVTTLKMAAFSTTKPAVWATATSTSGITTSPASCWATRGSLTRDEIMTLRLTESSDSSGARIRMASSHIEFRSASCTRALCTVRRMPT